MCLGILIVVGANGYDYGYMYHTIGLSILALMYLKMLKILEYIILIAFTGMG